MYALLDCLPLHWAIHSEGELVKIVDLSPTDEEFMSVVNKYDAEYSGKRKIVEVFLHEMMLT